MMSTRHVIQRVAAIALCATGLFGHTTAFGQEHLVFESHVQPILKNKCGKCHSDKVSKGGLDLSSMDGIRRAGESEQSIVADSLDDSLLWTMTDDGDMPPEGEPRLTDNELKLIRKWITSGTHSLKPSQVQKKQLGQHDVRPILLLRCAACHGAQRKDGGVDLRTTAGMRKGGTNGPALIPGKPGASLMIRRIESEACPPRDLLLKFFVRRPPKSEVDVLREWIANGAPEGDVEPDIATQQPDRLVSDDDRKHWAFQPPRRTQGMNSIDDFILAKLDKNGVELSPEANRDTLIRRAYIDLIGMPPSTTEWKRWRESNDKQWYRKMIDQLLGSSQYGERWGRYWLDLAGYADSEGGVSADPVRKVAWKYRDYVIQSFNEDKPYDRFLLEQLAGDELIDHAKASAITQEMVDNLIATGFLRMGIDQTGSRTMNFVPERLGVVADAIGVVGSSVMGLTMECARCHSHKYDAIPHRDYYRFKAIFQGALDEHDWLTFKNRTLNIDIAARRERVAKVNPPLTKKIKRLEGRLKKAQNELRLVLLQQHYPTQPETDRLATLAALRIADNNRSQPQRNLVERLQRAEAIPDDEQPAQVQAAMSLVTDLDWEILQIRRQLEPSLAIRALWDRGVPSPTYVLRRGDHDKASRLVGPGVPSVLTDGQTPFEVTRPFPNGTPKSGRRLAFARWLTQPNHPLTSRVMVNRVWYHHFGRGLVTTMENFGVKGATPTHPKLLDWLAIEFVERGWSIKELHRLIMLSRSYRQSSHITEDRQRVDPQNRLLSHMPVRRMDAETIRDSLLSVAGQLDMAGGGPPDPITVSQNGLVSAIPLNSGRWRRSVYLQYRRTEIPSIMATFDYPEMGPNCTSRSNSTVSPQSLMMMNNEHVHQLARELAARIVSLKRDATKADQIRLASQLVLTREPTPQEETLGIEALTTLQSEWNGNEQAALASYCHTLLNSAAFLFVD